MFEISRTHYDPYFVHCFTPKTRYLHIYVIMYYIHMIVTVNCVLWVFIAELFVFNH